MVNFLVKIFFALSLSIIFSHNISANNLQLKGELTQGGIVLGFYENAKKVFLDKKNVVVSDKGYFFLGFSRKHKKTSLLKIFDNNNNVYSQELHIKSRKYHTQRIDGLPKKKVQPGPKELKKIKADYKILKDALRKKAKINIFPEKFLMPVEGRISGVYGSQRILNGVKKNPHMGLDIAAPTGTPIQSTTPGKVLLAVNDLFYTGNTIIIDHGYELKSIYIHLDKIYVKENDLVKEGQEIGTVGMTGRATGPHLHWGVYWKNIKVDPNLLLLLK